MKCKECSGMGKISDCDIEGMWIEECKNCHGSGYLCTRIADSLNDKALLADAKVGDLVKLETGKWHKIKAIVQQHESCLDFLVYGLDNGIHYAQNGNGMRTDNLRIVEWQPLAPEGTAEWAWQMNKLLGKKVMHPHSNCITDGNIMREHKDIFLAVTFPTGWQLYEPKSNKVQGCDPCSLSITDLTVIVGTCLFNLAGKGEPSSFYFEGLESDLKLKLSAIAEHKAEPIRSLEPAFKVGDWVEMDYKGTLYHRQVISVHDNGIRVEFAGATPLLSFDGKNNMVSMRLVRKLAPSEVIINIGCLSGRIEALTCNCCKDKVFVLLLETGGFIEIPFSALDKPTSKLVKKLLKAQEELCQ